MSLSPLARLGLAGPLIAVLLALAAAGCGGGSSSENVGVKPVSASSCAPVSYHGPGKAQALIVSDLPMRGDSAERSAQQVDAIRLALDEAHWRAGDVRVAFQPCDDSLAKTGLWAPRRCRSNARAYGADADVLGVIGTYNSGCAALEIPILDRAELAMISPGNTDVCLTETASTCADGLPTSLYPGGRHNYARVVPNDAVQGAGLAAFARSHGVSRPFVLYAADDPTSLGQATAFRGAADSLGLDVVGFRRWSVEARDYRSQMEAAKRAGADAVVLAGLLEQNGAKLIEDKVAVLGPNDGDVKLLAFDGFAQQATIGSAKGAAAGMFASLPGRAPSSLPGRGRAFVRRLAKRTDGRPVELFAPYAGQAAELMLDAIGASTAGGGRPGTIAALSRARVKDGIVGSFRLLPSGDPNLAPITVSVARGSFGPVEELIPGPSTVLAARR